jgi:hypothetical protein
MAVPFVVSIEKPLPGRGGFGLGRDAHDRRPLLVRGEREIASADPAHPARPAASAVVILKPRRSAIRATVIKLAPTAANVIIRVSAGSIAASRLLAEAGEVEEAGELMTLGPRQAADAARFEEVTKAGT